MDEYIIEIEGVSKSFPGVKALEDVRFNLKAGEVVALLGENGAGKSTLMKILSGVYSKDAGTVKAFGQMQEMGIAIIHQELNMCQHLTVAENIYLGREKVSHGVLGTRGMNQGAAELLGRLNIDISPEMIVGDLPLSKQQMVEIAKALSTNARVLIMDEPTSALTAKEIDDLFQIIHKLKSEGCGIVYISHRLEELQQIVDRVVILRDGRYITDMNFADTSLPEIISYMVGRDIKEKFPQVKCEVGDVVFEVKNLNAGRLVRDVSFHARTGEIVGIAGLMGAGRTETTRAIFGVDPKESGEIFLQGQKVKIRKLEDSIRAGIVLAPEDRKKDGLCTKLSIRENIALPNLDMICDALGIIRRKVEDRMCDKAVETLQIKTPNLGVDAATLSGGNQQKVVVGKWLARDSKVVIFDEPTRGIDVGAKVEIYHLMNQLKRDGIAVIFIFSEMPEILGIADRIIVMCDGRVTGELMREEADQEKILTLATQFEKKISDVSNEEELVCN